MELGDGTDCPRNVVGLDIDRGLGRGWHVALLAATLATAGYFLAVLVQRWRTGGVATRRVLVPVVHGACAFSS